VSTALYFRVQPAKSFSKVLCKRLAVKLMPTQNALCHASGMADLSEVYALQAQGVIDERVELLDYETWLLRLGFEFGSDLEALFKPTELQKWFDLIHGTAVGTADYELSEPDEL